MRALLILLLVSPLHAADFHRYDPIEIGDADTYKWTEQRWIEFLARRLDNGEWKAGKLQFMVPTATGHVVEIQQDEISWEVCYDHEWEQAISKSIMGAAAMEGEPGVFLLVPDARTEHYMRCRVVVERLRLYGVPMHIRTMTIPEQN